ncbi:hypothetical protein [Brucella anthropi]|uniref:hypothetical protein n=1 Tax=Brucella anthropi TaxID=529 RepID=UPI003D97AECB
MTAELRDSNENSENQTLVACICTACSCRMRNGEKMDEDKWSSFGFRPGTGAFANCMMEQSAHVEDDNRRWGAKRQAQEERDRERKKERRRRAESQVDDRLHPGSAKTRTLIHKTTIRDATVLDAWWTIPTLTHN